MELEEILSVKNRKNNTNIRSQCTKDRNPTEMESIFEIDEEENQLQQSEALDITTENSAKTQSETGYQERSESVIGISESNNQVTETSSGERTFTAVTEELIKKSSIYAVAQVGNSQSNFRRIMWLFVLIAGLLGCGYQIHKFLNLYFRYPIIVNLEVEPNLSLDFPAVTICNLNPIKRIFEECLDEKASIQDCLPVEPIKKLPKLDFNKACDCLKIPYGKCPYSKTGNEKCLRRMLRLDACQKAWNRTIDENCLQEIINFDGCRDLMIMRDPELDNHTVVSCSSTLSGKYDLQKDFELKLFMKYSKMDKIDRFVGGYQDFELIKECSFNGESCSSKHFSLFQSLRYGNCYTFNKSHRNSTRRLTTYRTGYSSGLELTLDLRSKDYLSTSCTFGAKVIIHDPSDDPDPENKGLIISPGFKTSISLKQTHISRLPAPYQDRCVEYGTGDRSKENTQDVCMQFCLQIINYDTCGCVDPTIPSTKDLPICDLRNTTDICCLESIDEDTCNCPLPCHSTNYNEIVSTSTLPSSVMNTGNEEMFTSIYSHESTTEVQHKESSTSDESTTEVEHEELSPSEYIGDSPSDVKEKDYNKSRDTFPVDVEIKELFPSENSEYSGGFPADDADAYFKRYCAELPAEESFASEYSDQSRTKVVNDLLRLKIYYSTLESSVYQQKPMFQESELFSHLGGELGLWLGLSLVALFEVMDNVMYLVKFAISAAFKSSKNSGSNDLIIS